MLQDFDLPTWAYHEWDLPSFHLCSLLDIWQHSNTSYCASSCFMLSERRRSGEMSLLCNPESRHNLQQLRRRDELLKATWETKGHWQKAKGLAIPCHSLLPLKDPVPAGRLWYSCRPNLFLRTCMSSALEARRMTQKCLLNDKGVLTECSSVVLRYY